MAIKLEIIINEKQDISLSGNLNWIPEQMWLHILGEPWNSDNEVPKQKKPVIYKQAELRKAFS